MLEHSIIAVPITVLPADGCPCELCVDVKWAVAEPGGWRKRSNLDDTLPAQSGYSRDIKVWVKCSASVSNSQMPNSVVCLWGNSALVCPPLFYILMFYLFILKFMAEKADLPKPSDSNRHVSPTPTSRHQARKLAVLSRAKKEPEGALCRHGIFR